MHKKFVLVFILVSANCFTGELKKCSVYDAEVLPSVKEGLSLLQRLPLDLTCRDEDLQRLRKLLPEKVIFRDASYLMEGSLCDSHWQGRLPGRLDFDRLSLEEYHTMKDNGKCLWEEADSSASDSRALARMKLLIESHACVNCIYSRSSDKNELRSTLLTPLECAVVNKNVAHCKLLAQTNAKARVEYLIYRDSVKLIKLFIDKPYLDKYDVTLQAMNLSKNKILGYLIRSYVNTFNTYQMRALLKVYSRSNKINYDLFNILLEKASGDEFQDLWLSIAKMAISSSRQGVLECVLRSKIKCLVTNQVNELLEEYSKLPSPRKDLLKLLLENSRADELERPLLPNVAECPVDILKLVFKYTKVGLYEALRQAVISRSPDSVKFLLRNGGDPNLVIDVSTNETLLMRAARDGQKEIVTALLNHREIDKQRTNSEGQNAAILALRNNHKDIANIILGGRTCGDSYSNFCVRSADKCSKCPTWCCTGFLECCLLCCDDDE